MGNRYATSIHAVTSCVLKLAKVTAACKVYRGLKDAQLPDAFFTPNQYGVRGGIEYGFSSTTTDREQALHYAGASGNDALSASTVLEMQMGMVDRGADLAWLSQYPHEREILFPPLLAQEVLSTTVHGNSLVVQCRLCLLYTSPSPRDGLLSRMPSSA